MQYFGKQPGTMCYGPGACSPSSECCALSKPIEVQDDISNAIPSYRATVIDRFILYAQGKDYRPVCQILSGLKVDCHRIWVIKDPSERNADHLELMKPSMLPLLAGAGPT